MNANWYADVPVVTRTYMTMAFMTTLACSLEIITPLSLYLNTNLIYSKYQVWRLLTNFLFFGNFGIDFLFHLFFLYRYARSLEEGSFRRRTSDFFFMLLFGALFLIGVTVALAPPIHFLGSSLTFMLVYVWSKRNRDVQMRFLQMFNFTAPYLPWVLLAFSVLLHNNAVVDLMGIGAGHLYFFLEDVYPQLEGGRRVLITPGFIKAMFGEAGQLEADAAAAAALAMGAGAGAAGGAAAEAAEGAGGGEAGEAGEAGGGAGAAGAAAEDGPEDWTAREPGDADGHPHED